jgi:transcriptional regulator with XRE-family HTH domain
MKNIEGIGTVATLEELPLLIRIARRGRTFEEAAAEADLNATTLRRAERGEDVSLSTLRAITAWTNIPVLVSRSTVVPHGWAEVPAGEEVREELEEEVDDAE